MKPPHGVDELEVWEGWYQHSGQRQSTSLVLYVTSSNRLCGYGNDLNGEWTCEGTTVVFKPRKHFSLFKF